ncbi:hypothetical protein [Nocardioides marmotae]|uniref:hypothetical protein n=1 Tax=Nocardioides marmotae TaxID=2663857 RepID=UPI0012B630C4|nr:hypothetical protein [Nocardioides marmotae]MBC9733279.1 hypothetical protein [Nocardioides marmotae]MTB84389.1 hypothetical protein [Nocardioides marmotae]
MDSGTARPVTLTAVERGDRRDRPAFWYDEAGAPRDDVEAVACVLAEQGYDLDAITGWFVRPNPGLPGRAAPVDLLPAHVGRVLALAGSARPSGRAPTPR